MDTQKLFEWFVTVLFGGLVVKLIDYWFIEPLQKRRARKQEKIDQILKYLNAYGELVELYRFFAHVERGVRTDGKGEILLEEKVVEPEPRFEEAISALRDSDLKPAIAQQIARIRFLSAEALDLAGELDKSGKLVKKLTELDYQSVSAVEIYIRNKNFPGLVEALRKAGQVRKDARSMLEKLR